MEQLVPHAPLNADDVTDILKTIRYREDQERMPMASKVQLFAQLANDARVTFARMGSHIHKKGVTHYWNDLTARQQQEAINGVWKQLAAPIWAPPAVHDDFLDNILDSVHWSLLNAIFTAEDREAAQQIMGLMA